LRLSVCTTNYNCAHVLNRHLDSVFENLRGHEFEYIVVDNRSRDASARILDSYAATHPNMTVFSRRCTIGEGREIAFSHSHGDYLVILDTDVVYSGLLRQFVDAYLQRCPDRSVQAIFCGIFPRAQWVRAGGRRSFNTNEDVDLWARIARCGTMMWYPVELGENVKEAVAWGIDDYLSHRYRKREKIVRLMRREWDLVKTRKLEKLDIAGLIEANTIDLGLGPVPRAWPIGRTRRARMERIVGFVRELKQIWLA